MYKRWREKIDSDYETYVKKLVQDSRQAALKENVFIPSTEEEYLMINKKSQPEKSSPLENDMTDDMFNDDYAYDSYSECTSSESEEERETLDDDKNIDEIKKTNNLRRSTRLKNRDDSLISWEKRKKNYFLCRFS